MTYGGVYEALVVSSSDAVLDVLIPQIYREQTVPVTKWVGQKPVPSTKGFVSFISGDAAWPVWLGASN